jgi:hypothetical protein
MPSAMAEVWDLILGCGMSARLRWVDAITPSRCLAHA